MMEQMILGQPLFSGVVNLTPLAPFEQKHQKPDVEKMNDLELVELNARVQFEMKKRQDKKAEDEKNRAYGLSDLCRICLDKKPQTPLVAFSCGHVCCETCDLIVQDSVLPAGQPVRTIANGVLSTGPIDLSSSDVTGTLPTSSLSGTIPPTDISPAPTITPGLNLTIGTSSWPSWTIDTNSNGLPTFQTINLTNLTSGLPVCTTGVNSQLVARSLSLALGSSDTVGLLDIGRMNVSAGANMSISAGGVFSVTGIGTSIQAHSGELDALTGLGSAGTGFLVQTGVNTLGLRSISGTAAQITVTNGSGVSAGPTIGIDPTYPGQTSITTVGTLANPLTVSESSSIYSFVGNTTGTDARSYIQLQHGGGRLASFGHENNAATYGIMLYDEANSGTWLCQPKKTKYAVATGNGTYLDDGLGGCSFGVTSGSILKWGNSNVTPSVSTFDGTITFASTSSVSFAGTPSFANIIDNGVSANGIIYANSSKQFSSVTLAAASNGASLSFSAGTLSVTNAQDISSTASPTFNSITTVGTSRSIFYYPATSLTTGGWLQLGATGDFLTSHAFGLGIAAPTSAINWPFGICVGGGSSSTVAFQVGTGKQVQTANSTLDDGSGAMTVKTSLTVGSTLGTISNASNYSATGIVSSGGIQGNSWLATVTGNTGGLYFFDPGTGHANQFQIYSPSANNLTITDVPGGVNPLVISSGQIFLTNNLTGTLSSTGAYFSITARASRTSNAAVVSGDTLGAYTCQGYDGAAYQSSSFMITRVDGTVSAGIVPGRLNFYTTDNTGAANLNLTIRANKSVSTFFNQLDDGTGAASFAGTVTAANVIDSGLTANTIVYGNGSKQLTSVSLGAASNGASLSFSGGVLSATNSQNLTTAGSPSFAGLSLTGQLTCTVNSPVPASFISTSTTNFNETAIQITNSNSPAPAGVILRWDSVGGIQIQDTSYRPWLVQGGTTVGRVQTYSGNILDDGNGAVTLITPNSSVTGGLTIAYSGATSDFFSLFNLSATSVTSNYYGSAITSSIQYQKLTNNTEGSNPWTVISDGTNIGGAAMLSSWGGHQFFVYPAAASKVNISLTNTQLLTYEVMRTASTGVSFFSGGSAGNTVLKTNGTVVTTLKNTLDDGQGRMTLSYAASLPTAIMTCTQINSGSASYTKWNNNFSGYAAYAGLDGNGYVGLSGNAFVLSTGSSSTPIYLSPGLSTTWGLCVDGSQKVSTRYNVCDDGITGQATFNGIVDSTLLSTAGLVSSDAGKKLQSVTIANSNGCNTSFSGTTLTCSMSQNLSTSGTPTLAGLTISNSSLPPAPATVIQGSMTIQTVLNQGYGWKAITYFSSGSAMSVAAGAYHICLTQNSGTYTATLPASRYQPVVSGTVYCQETIFSVVNGASGILKIQTSGTDVIIWGASNVTSFTISGGQAVILRSDGIATWYRWYTS